MEIEHLLQKGYFPKELPPPFTTELFSNNFHSIADSWNNLKSELGRTNPNILKDKKGYEKSKCVLFSIPKKNYSRRNIEIPNPFHHSALCETICHHWIEINHVYEKSKISTSIPTVWQDGERAVRTSYEFNDFKQECLIESYDKKYELKIDISWFYPTIYTHTIPWAVHGKELAKKDRSDRLFGNLLDRDVRNCKHGQTSGIPIGPDTSMIIAEIISCGIDQLLQEKLGLIKGCRYYDDVYLYFSTREEAEEGLKTIQYILTDFQLSINEEKTKIDRFPSTFDDIWVIQINSYEFREDDIWKTERDRVREQRTDIERYFKLAFHLANKYPNEAVLSYAIKKFQSIAIINENWNLFESLILKIAILNPLVLQFIVPLLLAYDSLVDKQKISNVVEEIIKNNAKLGHSFEISWALWLAKTFDIRINDSIAKDIFNSNDVIPILIALDLKSKNLIDASVESSHLIEDLTEDSLFEEKWLLTYESIIHEWLIPINSNPLETNEYFNILKDFGVKFYDDQIKAKPLKIKELNGENLEEETYPVESTEYESPDEYLSYYM